MWATAYGPTPARARRASATSSSERSGSRSVSRSRRPSATSVAKGRVDLEALAATSRDDLPDGEVATQLQALPGVGPYAAAHIMLMLARYDRLILDSWTRPTYARLLGRKRPISDRAIERRFKRYGPYAGLAFWLFLT